MAGSSRVKVCKGGPIVRLNPFGGFNINCYGKTSDFNPRLGGVALLCPYFRYSRALGRAGDRHHDPSGFHRR